MRVKEEGVHLAGIYMDDFIKLVVLTIKVVLKIIEGVIRALVEVAFDFSFSLICASTGLAVGFYILGYAACEGDHCLTSASANSLAMVTGCALTLFAAYSIYKRMF
ncbi:hypothetical protein ABMA27_003943 [Loxostege sticticalis]|uniref:Uncharacterized protein n=1 Tax=Loxostege sticticalis TaxID=481309 RepID=A0ABR3HQV8_LOXSC